MFSRRACTRRRTAPPSGEDESARCSVFTDRVQWVIDRGVSGVIRRAGAEINRINPLRRPPVLHRPHQRRLGSRPRWIIGANPIAPCHRVTRAVEIPTTVAPGSDRRHWLKLTRPPPRTHHHISERPADAGAQHIILGMAAARVHLHENSRRRQGRRPLRRRTQDAEIGPPRNVGVVAVGWRPLLQARGSGRASLDNMITQPARCRVEMRRGWVASP